ncbi:MAG: DUF3833 domain-containing protein [Opitutales bacterium]|jgi:hypothetical protein
MKIEDYKDEKPVVDVKEHFNGPIKAWGLIQGRNGKVLARFDVEMVGRWEGDSGVLEESFDFYDGRTQRRVWKIQRTGDNQYEGRAGDIIGKAKGEQSGNAVRWSYDMDLEVGGKTYKIRFDDWMWLMNDGILINRSYLKKFGFTVAELTLFMQKVDS